MDNTPQDMLAGLQDRLKVLEELVADAGENQADAMAMLVQTVAALRGQAVSPAERQSMRYRLVDVTTARAEFSLAVAQQLEVLAKVYTLIGHDEQSRQAELEAAEHFNHGYDTLAMASDDEHEPSFHLNRALAHGYAAQAIRLRAKMEGGPGVAAMAEKVGQAIRHEEEARRHHDVFAYLTGREDDGNLSR